MAPRGAAPSVAVTGSGRAVEGLSSIASACPTPATSALPAVTTIDVDTPSANEGPVPASTDTGAGTMLCAASDASGEDAGIRTGTGTAGGGGAHADITSANARTAEIRAAESLLRMGAIIIAQGGEDNGKAVARAAGGEASPA